MEMTVDGVTARWWWDEQTGCPAGWCIEYSRHGEVIDDSLKVWHPEVPSRRNATRAIERVARAYARSLSR